MTLHAADFIARKGKHPITMLTAYTCPVARGIEAAGVPVILVGDTVGMVEMGFESTRDVTLEHMEYHIGAVRRGARNTHIIGDLPYLTDSDPQTALTSARRLIAAGASSIKLEGPKDDIIRHLVENGIAVVGHTGLTPQTATSFKKVGNTEAEAQRILDEAKLIEQAGAFMVVLEHIPYNLGGLISRSLSIPTIGIGAGPECDGQVLVINDALGLGDYWPPFSKQYAHVSDTILKVARDFTAEVESLEFPNNIIQFTGSGKR
ncbi:MAG TPA: 3-methyl-2-oxobutanoate hydroxymethyltransferase [Pseudomonas sabulinigri]|uniref:3-methyl-2-oxobutanoate hydroxymethyltransferase n=1 Tax=marine sediment metagenome TaxID=412755 RepID=A0A0F9WF16_9ZZZZ|nr:3-methyl-2-oxobutanoate hydroxymethyltransferase [Halopseudomonas sabulinigri]HEC53728.1 3-methyl-2-oxobutanoate hydroxymethyltransferase [Halopseudomonas sabulinigri]